VVRGLPGGDHRWPKNEMVFNYSGEAAQALAAADEIRLYADGE
jgi:hypothetical protein